MGFFDFVKKKFGSKAEPQQPIIEQTRSERQNIKDGIGKTLRKMNFTELELREVNLIIDDAQDRIKSLKTGLNGSSIYKDPTMQADLKSKVQEILERKKKLRV